MLLKRNSCLLHLNNLFLRNMPPEQLWIMLCEISFLFNFVLSQILMKIKKFITQFKPLKVSFALIDSKV